jgi:twitching motility protein PilT
MAAIPPGIRKLLTKARQARASDIHIAAGAPILFRIGKDLVPASEGVVTPELSERLAMDMLGGDPNGMLRSQMDCDLMVGDDDGRYRVNICLASQSVGLVIRILPEEARSIDQLHLPPVLKTLAGVTKGMVLITGATSQGKTATLSAIINEINRTQRRHIVTIEDPVETIHVNKLSLVRQREVGRDTKSFAAGLRAALRQDPDVIAIGEMRDYETIKIALTAADTGALVLSTLHIISIDKLLERLLSYAASDDDGHLRYLLADALQGVVHQELLPTIDGGKRVACEVLLATDAVKNIIRRRDSFMLRSVIQAGGRHGMITMRQSVGELVSQGIITPEVAETVLVNY